MVRFFHEVQRVVGLVFNVPDLKMEMGTSAPPRATHKSNHLALSNGLAPQHAAPFQVSVQGGPAVRMPYFNQVAEARPIVSSKDDFSSIGCEDGRSHLCSKIHTVVMSRTSHPVPRADEAVFHGSHKLLLGFLDLHGHSWTSNDPFCEPPDVHGCDFGRGFGLGRGGDPSGLNVSNTSDAWFLRFLGYGRVQSHHHVCTQVLQCFGGTFHGPPGASVDTHRAEHELRGHAFGTPPSFAPSEAHGDVGVRVVAPVASPPRLSFECATMQRDHHNA
eukprot:CAMPEP_0183833406 /NCGR_PEP_ID=MMETSP0807_2-20130328/6044_1 /TAXON_ID=88271 /ORGANISM="Picocystis salinarum, Strain CCMP1897" /LENGTH=273 /DNA_ID=CAMNT_0026079351 /DNA_START=165 /DNA_END=982 /DNA_ORIENTATION=+